MRARPCDSSPVFTGLIQSIGTVRSASPTPSGVRLAIEGPGWALSHGESIAVSGCCLTVVDTSSNLMSFDAIPETLSKTTLGALAPGSKVNLERALQVGDRLGGHFVQGHIDGLGTVERVQTSPNWRVWVRLPAPLMKFMAPKGSICIDGVSLTLAEVNAAASTIAVALIPTTLELTTLSTLTRGQHVNIEADPIAKSIVNYLEHFAPPSPPHPTHPSLPPLPTHLGSEPSP